jgi:5'-3' exonuclease
LTVNHFCIDFNSIIYDTVRNSVFVKKVLAIPNLTTAKFENRLAKEIVGIVAHLINNVVRPNKSVYIAIDGPVPRAKMMQSRERRYKTLLEREIRNRIAAKYPTADPTDNEKIYNDWNPSQNASPGTKFMKKLSVEMTKAAKGGVFSRNGPLNIIFSDTTVPGEGEHKYIPFIKNLEKTEDREDSVAVLSPDADAIMIAALQTKSNLFVFRRVSADDIKSNPALTGLSYIYISTDSLKESFYQTTLETMRSLAGAQKFDSSVHTKETILRDYFFLLFLAGNDFITPIPFLKMVNNGMDILMTVYSQIFARMKTSLIHYNSARPDVLPRVDPEFFYQIINEIGLMEDRQMKMYYNKIKRERTFTNARPRNAEPGVTPQEQEINDYMHTVYYNPTHPDFAKYNPMFDLVNYDQQKHVWKTQYYQNFFHMNPANSAEYDEIRTRVCHEYIKALQFTLQYYLTSTPPSWSWYYSYHNAPIPSDLAFNLSRMRTGQQLSEIGVFEPTESYKPFEQLMMVLPPQTVDLLPKAYRVLLKEDEINELTPYYPREFELDVVTGGKFIHSHPLLPNLPGDLVVAMTRPLEKKLTAEEKERNRLRMEPEVFTV